MKFNDKDICSFIAHPEGVVLKVNASNILDMVDDEGVTVVYLFTNEVNSMLESINNSPEKSTYHTVSYKGFCLNAAHLDQVTILLDANVIETCVKTKRNRAYIFIKKEDLVKISNKLADEVEKANQVTVFNEVFKAATGCNLGVAKDSNKVIMIPA